MSSLPRSNDVSLVRRIETLLASGQVPEALGCLRGYLEGAPGDAPALLFLSRTLSQYGLRAEAADAALAAWAAGSSDASVVHEIGRRLRYFNEYETLAACYTDDAFFERAPAQALTEASLALSSIGQHEQAVALVERSLEMAPGLAVAHYMRGNLRSFAGDFDGADDDYERALERDPRLFQAAWMQSGLRTQVEGRHHVDRLRRQLATATPGRVGEVYLEFALHKELHDLGDFDRAWEHLEAGCRKKRCLVNYSAMESRDTFAALRQVCTREFTSAMVPAEMNAVPIFIVGMHRSGTSLVERILAGHSSVHDGGETYAFIEQMRRATGQSRALVADAPLIQAAATVDFRQVASGYGRQARWLARGKPFFTEKLPSNLLHAGFIAKALPSAKIVCLSRAPMEMAFSNLRTLFAEAAPYSYDQTELADYVLQHEELLRTWQRVLGDRLLVLDYARLVERFEEEVLRLCDFCGLDFEQGMLDLMRAGGAVTTASATQLRGGLRRDRATVWHPYAAHLEPLSRALT